MAQQTISVATQQTAVFNSLVPPEGPKAVTIPLDFSTATSFEIDFTQAYAQGVISVVQTLWCDNSGNADDVIFTVAGSNQTIVVPAATQGSFPVISAIRTKINVVSSATGIVKCIFLNVPLPIGTWSPDGSQVTIVGQPIEVTVTAGTTTAAAGASFSIVTGGTAQTAFTAASIVNGGIITNPWGATESLFVDPVNAAQVTAPGTNGTTTELKAGQSFTLPGGLTNAVSVNANTAAHAFTSWKW